MRTRKSGGVRAGGGKPPLATRFHTSRGDAIPAMGRCYPRYAVCACPASATVVCSRHTE